MRFQNILSPMMAMLVTNPFRFPGFMMSDFFGPGEKTRRKKSTIHPRNGKREVARRLRQIAAGQLTRSNGLVTADELYGRRAA